MSEPNENNEYNESNVTNETHEDLVLKHKQKRKKHKIKLASTSIFLIIVALVLLYLSVILKQKYFITFIENTTVDYGVNLIDNEFYTENYIEKGKDVISSLIKDIDVEFKYSLDLEEELEYTYDYEILGRIEVKEKNRTNLLYESEHQLFNSEEQTKKSNKLEISEKINVNYNDYNNQITKLLESYQLSNTSSDLFLNFNINIINKSTGEKINTLNKVATLQIPLANRTIEFSINENVKKTENSISKENQFIKPEYIFAIAILILFIGLLLFVLLIKYILDTRSAEKMYDAELKKILFDYKSYLQTTNDKFDYSDYKVITINTFIELLGMKEEIQAPILMYTEKDIRKTTFIIIDKNLLFEYTLSSELIREKLIRKSNEKKEKENLKKKKKEELLNKKKEKNKIEENNNNEENK